MIKAKFKHLRILKFNWVSISGQCTIFLTTITSDISVQNHREKYGDGDERNNKHYFVTITAQKPISALPLLSTWVNALQRAVYCENCGYFGMEKLKRTWFCRRCQHQCMYAHIQALKDYYMLVGHTITNRECRTFLMLECKHVTKRLLQETIRSCCNSGKLTKYDLSSLWKRIKILDIATKRTENATKLKKALQNTNKSPPESYFKPTIIQNRTQKIL